MKSIVACIWIFSFTLIAYGELGITVLQRNGTLTWTNSISNAVYRIESAPSVFGPWNTWTNASAIAATNTQVTVQLQDSGAQSLEFYRVVWTDAPPAQPIGDWEYRGFSPEGTLVATGLVSIAESNPLIGTCSFESIAAGTHPLGSGTFTNGVVAGSNTVQIPLTGFTRDNFRLSGQMSLNQYWGWWSYTDQSIDPSGGWRIITVSGRFSATRRQD